MRGFTPLDFENHSAYTTHHIQLERSQILAKQIVDLWMHNSPWKMENTPLYYDVKSLIDDAVQIGYESALGMPHRSSDYDIVPATLNTYPDKCQFCKHVYYVYGCEERCSRIENGQACDISVRDYL